MVGQHQLQPPPGSRHRRKRVGRGGGSGHGTYSGRGSKGQKARSGGHIPPRFQGGQLSLMKGLPQKRGFTNPFKKEFELVQVGKLSAFPAGTEVTPEGLLSARLIKSLKRPVKVLGEGELQVPLTVKAARFSQTARQKIEAAGGKAEEV